MLRILLLATVLPFIMITSCKNDDDGNAELCTAFIDNQWRNVALDNGVLEGTDEWKEFIRICFQNLKYPPFARETGIEGKTLIEFEISTVGKIENIEIITDPGGGIGEAAEFVVEEASKIHTFTPLTYKGEPVRVRKNHEFLFRLE